MSIPVVFVCTCCRLFHHNNAHISVIFLCLTGCPTEILRMILGCPVTKWVVSDARNALISCPGSPCLIFFQLALITLLPAIPPPPIRKKCNPDGQTAGRTDRMMTIGTVSVNIGKYLFIIVTCNFLHNININIMVINNRICRANLAYNVTLYKDIANKNVYSVPRRQTLGLQI